MQFLNQFGVLYFLDTDTEFVCFPACESGRLIKKPAVLMRLEPHVVAEGIGELSPER
jgi:hypothetical protein